MKKILGTLFRLILFGGFIVAGIMVVRTLGFTSRQIAIEAISPIDIPKGAADRLAAALTLATISTNSGIDTNAFSLLDTLIIEKYPLVDSMMEKIPVVPISKVYRWPGKNAKLKPILFLAHQDVVPVEENTIDKWTAPAFGGQKADGFIWGRGALDDKTAIISILEASEQLLSEGYVPERTIYFSFGHDEEIGGQNGAKKVADFFARKDIHFEYILDEGLLVLENSLAGLSQPLAMIGVAEKGYLTLRLDARLPEGGHSSMPPANSVIGILSRAIKRLEDDPFPGKIKGATRALFDHIGPEMSPLYRTLFANLWLTEGIINHQLSKDPSSSAIIRTTTAPTIIESGLKDNIMPTQASAQINFRILPGESIASVMARVKAVINDERITITPQEGIGQDEPSSVSGVGTFGFQVIQKSIQQVSPEVLVAPALTVGLTDSRHFRNLTDDIYRFRPYQVSRQDLRTFHGINEKISEANLATSIRFFRQLILNSCL
ncbi:MAG: peptidase M20 [Saprospiraceae bacterium]|nr:MAG: peptidase M20 [Saprospiraceae bacterium]